MTEPFDNLEIAGKTGRKVVEMPDRRVTFDTKEEAENQLAYFFKTTPSVCSPKGSVYEITWGPSEGKFVADMRWYSAD